MPRVVYLNPDPGMRDSLAGVMRFEGFVVEAVQDGDAAFAAVQRAMPDLVVLDGGLAGRDVCRHLRALTTTVPILVLTEPASIDSLLKRMHSLLKRPQSRDHVE